MTYNGAYVRGDLLSVEDQREALRTYPHRYTKEHKPAWAAGEWKDGKPYPVHFASDKEWLSRTLFPVKNGKRALRSGDSYSTPSYPDNPELRTAVTDRGIPESTVF